jgi:hypothetical protein
MKKTIPCFIFLLFAINTVFCQNNVGINVAQPNEALTVDRGIQLDNNNQNTGSSLLNGLRFGKTAVNSQLAGISSNRSGNAQSYGLDFYTGGLKTMSIASNGYVGINTPPSNYFLEVGGTVKGTTLRSAGSVYAEGGSVIAQVGNITAVQGNIVASVGELKAGGKGVVMSNTATRQRIYQGTATLTVTNFSAGNTATGTLFIPANTFNDTPTAYLGNVITANGDYYKISIVLENVTPTSVTVRVINLSNGPVTFTNASWNIMVVGPY